MRPTFKLLALLISITFIMGSSAIAGKSDPVAVLSLAKGKVEYTKNGKKWKKVRRNKFLFDGYQIRTGPDGGGKITNQKSGKNFTLGPNSLVEVTAKGLKAKEGSLASADEGNQLVSGLMKKFTKSQSYTTVRRSATKQKIEIDAVRDVVLSDEYPFLVWENLGKEYSYELKVGEKIYNIAPSNDPIVRAKIDPVEGEQAFFITVMKGTEKVTEIEPYKSRGEKKDRTVTWLKGDDQKNLSQTINSIQENYPGNSFMLGSLFEEKDLWVAAMDQYKQYLEENPDEIEMTPYLFRVYKKLKLQNIYKKELEEYKSALLE